MSDLIARSADVPPGRRHSGPQYVHVSEDAAPGRARAASKEGNNDLQEPTFPGKRGLLV